MPLSQETIKKIREDIRKAEKLLKDIEPEIERAKMAGLDVADQLKRARELRASIEKMKLVYGK